MSTQTPNLGLKKPGQNDFYNVDDFNGNSDILDGAVKNLSDSVSGLTPESIGLPGTIHPGTGKNAEVFNTTLGAPGENEASGDYSGARGLVALARKNCSFAEGRSIVADADYSHVGGYSSQAQGAAVGSFVHGIGLIARREGQAVFGKYNAWDTDKVFSIGNGSSGAFSDLFAIAENGNVYINNKLALSGDGVKVKTLWNGSLLCDGTGNLPFQGNTELDPLRYALLYFKFQGYSIPISISPGAIYGSTMWAVGDVTYPSNDTTDYRLNIASSVSVNGSQVILQSIRARRVGINISTSTIGAPVTLTLTEVSGLLPFDNSTS